MLVWMDQDNSRTWVGCPGELAWQLICHYERYNNMLQITCSGQDLKCNKLKPQR